VVLFGEMLPMHAVNRLYEELEQGFDLVFSIGTTSVFPYIAGPVMEAKRIGIPTVEINPGQLPFPPGGLQTIHGRRQTVCGKSGAFSSALTLGHAIRSRNKADRPFRHSALPAQVPV